MDPKVALSPVSWGYFLIYFTYYLKNIGWTLVRFYIVKIVSQIDCYWRYGLLPSLQLFMDYFTMKVNPMLANLPLNFNGGLTRTDLTSLVISTTDYHTGLVHFIKNMEVWSLLKHSLCVVLTHVDAKWFLFYNVIKTNNVCHQDPIRINCSTNGLFLHINMFVELLICNGITEKHKQIHQTNFINCIMN